MLDKQMNPYIQKNLESTVIDTDSREYGVLSNAVREIGDVQGLTCEIGVRSGGSSKLIMETLLEMGKKKTHIGIDPYGNIDYTHWNTVTEKLGYNNKMRNNMLKNLYTFCCDHDLDFLFFPLEDTEYFQRFNDGVPVYNEYKQKINMYSLVFFDGPHSTDLIKSAVDFFINKVPVGGFFVFDDRDQYPHMQKLDKYIKSTGFEIFQQGHVKISYKRTCIKLRGEC